MAVTAPNPIPKSEPDISRLNGFAGHTVTVTKFTQPRGSVGQMVVATSEMPLKQILSMQTSLPMQWGPGFYRFTVSDTGGTGDDSWMVRLGPVSPDGQQEVSMATQNGVPDAPPGAPSSTSRHLGHNFWYDESLQLLTTPWREIISWRQGDPLPKPPASAQHLTAVPANATPWSWPPGGQQQGGWGGFPMEPSSKERELERKLEEERHQRELERLQADIRRVQDETNKSIASAIEKLTALVTAKPSGESSELFEMRRRMEESERKRDEDRREAERREADRARDEQVRREIAATNDRMEKMLREASANKQDPMFPLLMQILTQMQSQSQNAVDAIRDAVAAAASASERNNVQMLQQLSANVMTPTTLVQLLQSAKHDANEGSREVVTAMKEAMGVQKEVFTSMLEVAGQGAQPWYAGAIQEGIQRIGGVAAALTERNQIAQQQTQQIAQLQQQRAAAAASAASAAGRQPPAARAVAGPPGAAPLAGVPIPQQIVASNERPVGTEVDGDTFVLQDGRRIPMQLVQREGWAKVLSWPEKVLEREILKLLPIGTGPTEDDDAPAAPSPATAAAPPAAKRGKARGKKSKEPDPEPEEITPENMRDTPPDIVRRHVLESFKLPDGTFDDDKFFGALLIGYIRKLRETSLPATEVAKHVLEGAAQLQSYGGPVPPAFDLLEAGQLQVLVERLFPVADVLYRDQVVTAIGAAIEAADIGEDDEGAE